jgi:hypothetical protein
VQVVCRKATDLQARIFDPFIPTLRQQNSLDGLLLAFHAQSSSGSLDVFFFLGATLEEDGTFDLVYPRAQTVEME